MNCFNKIVSSVFLSLMFSCASPDDEKNFMIFSSAFDFNTSDHGWEADFTGYPASEDTNADSIYTWNFERSTAPPSLNVANALRLSCYNPNGEIFMFIKKKVGGLEPNKDYNIVFEVGLGTNAVTGQNVILKAGASDVEPKKVIESNEYVLNIDKGSSFNPGEDIVILGDVALPSNVNYTLLTKSNDSSYSPFIVRSSSKGEIWLLVGTDSDYQGETVIYYTHVKVVFSLSE